MSSQDRGMEFDKEMKYEKREKTDRIELQNQEILRKFEENENYKYLEILEVDTIKYAEKKKNLGKSSSDEPENILKSNFIA